MKRNLLVIFLVLMGALTALSPAAAQSPYTFSLGVFGGIGDSLDSDAGSGSSSYQLSFNFAAERRTLVGVRVGELGFSDDSRFRQLTDPDLQFITVGGEYRYPEGYFESGLYLGLGFYKLSGTSLLTGRSADESSVGAAFGATGEFEINRRLAILVEGSAHWAVDFEATQFFLMGHVGLAFRF